MAPYASASSQIAGRFAMWPSMLKTPSVTTRTNLAPPARAACSWRSRSAMSELAYRYRAALHSRMPSMIEAWFSASEMIASSSPSSGSNTPAVGVEAGLA